MSQKVDLIWPFDLSELTLISHYPKSFWSPIQRVILIKYSWGRDLGSKMYSHPAFNLF